MGIGATEQCCSCGLIGYEEYDVLLYIGSGCKFSAEEETVVIELQAQFGNKWAKIATYLQGRTDNDVKNFWSTRRKRLERIKQTPGPPPLKSHTNKGKKVTLHQLPKVEIIIKH